MTDCLYYSDPTLRSFSARVVGRLEIDNHPAVILDRTAFYPEGGGQPGDRRQINQAQVIDVQAHDDAAHSACPERSRRVVHILSDPVAEDEVTCAIDWTRRFDLMQQHSGQHILSQAFVRLLDAETVAFHLNDDPNEGTVTIDLDRAGIWGHSGGGYAAWYAVLPRLSATRAGTIQLAVPVLAALAIAGVAQRTPRLLHDDPRPGDVLRLCADVSQARDILGFSVRVSLTEGLGRLLAWYQAQDKSPEELLEDEVTRNWNPKAARQAPRVPAP